jgi:hypothetical protein
MKNLAPGFWGPEPAAVQFGAASVVVAAVADRGLIFSRQPVRVCGLTAWLGCSRTDTD